MNPSTYRPDIDGLRAIAVLSVLIHHLNASWLPGGFVGVDIFFVISGFLITSQVYTEIRDGRFTIKRFYQRRINRIVPALVSVIAATCVAGWWLLSPADAVRLTQSALWAMLGVSNVFFWREYGNYFAGNAAEAPLLHTWSLGVEEQFYLLWPWLLLLMFRWSRRHMLGVLLLLVLATLAVSELALGVAASASYYLLPARLFELMVGGLLARWVDIHPLSSRRYAHACAVLGVALVGGSLLLLHKASAFPGLNALWPCLGAALLISAGNTSPLLARCLRFKPLVFIGLISYSLYLWHWPLIAYLHYLHIPMGGMVAVIVAGLSVLLAWLSWRFVEVPMRRSGALLSFAKVLLRRFLLPVGLLAGVAGLVFATQGFPQRFDPRVAAFERVLAAKPEVLRRGCHVPTALFDTPPQEHCKLGVEKPRFDGVLIGDSFANHFSGLIDEMAKIQGLMIMDYTMDGCPPILGFETAQTRSYVQRCLQRNQAVFKMLAEHPYRKVVMAGSWPRVPVAEELFAASITAVLKTGAQLTVILANSAIDRAESCSLRRWIHASAGGVGVSCDAPRQASPAYMGRIQARFPQVTFIDPNQVICGADTCRPVLSDVPLYRDSAHLNDVGSRLIGRTLMQQGVQLR